MCPTQGEGFPGQTSSLPGGLSCKNDAPTARMMMIQSRYVRVSIKGRDRRNA
jgi:hypothetical protein